MQRFLDTPELVEASPEQFRDGLERFAGAGGVSGELPEGGGGAGDPPAGRLPPDHAPDDYELWVRRGRGAQPRRWKRSDGAPNIRHERERR